MERKRGVGRMNEPIKLDTTEIQKLRCLLDANGIGYEVKKWGEGTYGFGGSYNLHILKGDTRYSFLLSTGSYGREEGLIEFYNFSEEPTGWLTADECMGIIKEELKTEGVEGMMKIDPKQEEIGVPEWFAEWFEGRGYEMSLYGIFNDLYTNSKSKMEEWSKQYEMGHAELQNDIASVQLHGKVIYEVEEEPKYYVLNKTRNSAILVRMFDEPTLDPAPITEIDEVDQFTEKEIKDYDKRFWPFAVKVEELEENGKN